MIYSKGYGIMNDFRYFPAVILLAWHMKCKEDQSIKPKEPQVSNGRETTNRMINESITLCSIVL